MRKLLVAICLSLTLAASGQVTPQDRIIEFPDIPGFITLKCDFHQHTVFSDGSVWPDIRVQEAIKDGLDAISITDHIEYQPHKDDIPHPDRNRPYEITLASAKNSDLIVINGSEITRSMPPGHANAIFLKDANALLVDDPVEVFRAAKKQDAFVFWNHPHWIAQSPDGIASLTETHKYLLKEGLMDGIEVVNDLTYSDEALEIALEYDLAIMGTSDIHGLVDWQYRVMYGGHRPVTLVFAKERSPAGIREALESRRTAAWFDNNLIGREEHVVPLIHSSVKIVSAAYKNNSTVAAITFENNSDVDFVIQNISDYTLQRNSDVFTIKSHDLTRLEVKTLEKMEVFELKFHVLNVIIAPGKHPEISLKVSMK